MMLDRKFIPNTPCLVNAGKADGQLAACFVIEVPDSLYGILESAKGAGIIHKTGGGTGFTFEKLRPSGVAFGRIAGDSLVAAAVIVLARPELAMSLRGPM